jgi:hypothetical protein
MTVDDSATPTEMALELRVHDVVLLPLALACENGGLENIGVNEGSFPEVDSD